MPAREPVFFENWCELAERWKVSPDTMRRVAEAAEDVYEQIRMEVQIISGYRTRNEQAALRRAGRPVALDSVSTHRTCPATGVDISLGFASTDAQKLTWGLAATTRGLRWGGGSKVDDRGIPLDWGHVDRGPRRS